MERRIRLTFPEAVFTNAEVRENVVYQEAVSSGEDFAIGSACAASLEFVLCSDYELAGECVYEIGTLTGEELRQGVRGDVVCYHGDVAFVGRRQPPYLSVWQQEEPPQPVKPVGALFVVGDKLYCGHDEAPYITAYTISGTSLVEAATPSLNAYQVDQVRRYCARGAALNRQGDALRIYEARRDGVMERLFEYVKMGLFTPEQRERKDDGSLAVTAYDRMARFDRSLDDWVRGLSYPLTASALLDSLCRFCGVPNAAGAFLHAGFLVRQSFDAFNLTGRQVLGWVGELAASFVRIDAQGRLTLGWYGSRGAEMTAREYTKLAAAEFVTAKIDKLQIRVTEDDVGVIYPEDASGDQVYVIENNALLYAQADAQLRPVAQAIFERIREFSYKPFSVSVFYGNPSIRAGDIVKITTAAGDVFDAPIMSRKLSGVVGVRGEYEAVGNPRRREQGSAVNLRIQMLDGRVHEMVSNIEEFRSTVTEYQKKTDKSLQTMSTAIQQNSGEIALKASQSAVDAIGKRVGSAEAAISVNSREITSKVSQTDYNGNTIASMINQSATTIQIQAERVNIAGYLTAGNAVFKNKSGSDEVGIADGEIYFVHGGARRGSIRASQNGVDKMTIQFIDSLRFYQTDESGAYYATPLACDRNGMSIDSDLDITGIVTVSDGLSVYGTLHANGDLGVVGDFDVSGSKHCVQQTQTFGRRLVNAYETAESYFGDIGEGVVRGGECVVRLEDVFRECVNTDLAYQVFLSAYGDGRVYVAERLPDRFVVRGDDIPFGWEVKAKRRGHETERLEEKA